MGAAFVVSLWPQSPWRSQFSLNREFSFLGRNRLTRRVNIPLRVRALFPHPNFNREDQSKQVHLHYCHLGVEGTIGFEMQAIIKSLLATVQGKQAILMQKHFQLSQNPFQPISELYLNLEIHVILVVNVRGSSEYRTPEIRFSTKVVWSVFMPQNTTSPMGGTPGMGESKKVGGQSTSIGPYRFNTVPIY